MTKKAFDLVGGGHGRFDDTMGGLWASMGDPVGGQWLVPILRDIVLIDIVEEKEKPAYSGLVGGDN